MKLNQTLFLAGIAAAGLLGTNLPAQDASTNAPSDTSTNAFRARMAPHGPPGVDTMLNLTDDQKTKVDPILADERQKTSAVMQDATLSPEDKRAKIAEIRKNTTAQLQPILTAEQFQKWQRMRAFLRRPAVVLPPPGPGTPGAGIPGTNAPADHP
jgi:Spy/CpxP family protein refolding chaperone